MRSTLVKSRLLLQCISILVISELVELFYGIIKNGIAQ